MAVRDTLHETQEIVNIANKSFFIQVIFPGEPGVLSGIKLLNKMQLSKFNAFPGDISLFQFKLIIIQLKCKFVQNRE